MNIGLIGSGGREHALCKKIYESKLCKKIICFPGNAGTSGLAENIEVDILDFKKILKLIRLDKINLVIVGPEEPLSLGIVDFLTKNKIKVFGPTMYAARLEGSKAFMKRICKKNNIPTANFQVCENKKQVLKFLNESKLPLVVKADGLAAGKGVTICKNKTQVLNVADEIFKGKFKSSKKLIIEEFLNGEEASYFLVVDKNSFKFFGTAQDHKRVNEGDLGPNTGGMGAYSPAPIINKSLEKKIIQKIVKPTLQALKKERKPYTGFLYVGLMIKNNEPYLIEYNVRMGDPECQTILPLIDSDLLEIIDACCNSKLETQEIKWKNKKSMCIALCSKGYPEKYNKNVEIKNLKEFKSIKDNFIFHAGTKSSGNKILAVGGRVINFVNISDSYLSSRKEIINQIKKLNWEDGFYRSDIGHKVIDK